MVEQQRFQQRHGVFTARDSHRHPVAFAQTPACLGSGTGAFDMPDRLMAEDHRAAHTGIVVVVRPVAATHTSELDIEQTAIGTVWGCGKFTHLGTTVFNRNRGANTTHAGTPVWMFRAQILRCAMPGRAPASITSCTASANNWLAGLTKEAERTR